MADIKSGLSWAGLEYDYGEGWLVTSFCAPSDCTIRTGTARPWWTVLSSKGMEQSPESTTNILCNKSERLDLYQDHARRLLEVLYFNLVVRPASSI